MQEPNAVAAEDLLFEELHSVAAVSDCCLQVPDAAVAQAVEDLFSEEWRSVAAVFDCCLPDLPAVLAVYFLSEVIHYSVAVFGCFRRELPDVVVAG